MRRINTDKENDEIRVNPLNLEYPRAIDKIIRR